MVVLLKEISLTHGDVFQFMGCFPDMAEAMGFFMGRAGSFSIEMNDSMLGQIKNQISGTTLPIHAMRYQSVHGTFYALEYK